jgi:hypothetical protein
MTIDRRTFLTHSTVAAALCAGGARIPQAFGATPAAANSQPTFFVDVGPLTGAAPTITDYSGYAYCPAVDALLLFGGGHAATAEDVVLRFPIDTQKWSADYPATPMSVMKERNAEGKLAHLAPGKFWRVEGEVPPLRPVARHSYTGFVWSSAIKRMVLLGTNQGVSYGLPNETLGGNVAEYDPVGKTWHDAGCSAGDPLGACCEDPVSGNIVHVNQTGVRVYLPRERKWLAPSNVRVPGIGYAENLVHYPPNDRFYYFGRQLDPATGIQRVWEFSLARPSFSPQFGGAARALPAPMRTNWRPPPAGDGSTRYVYDSATQLIVGSLMPGMMLGFRPRADGTGQWLIHPVAATGRTHFYCHAYVPRTNTHYVVSDTNKGHRTFAFRWDPAQAKEAVDPRPPAARITANGATVASLQRACDAGGEVRIAAGELHDAVACAAIRHPVTIQGSGTKIVAAGIEGKGIFVVSADCSLIDVDISGARVGDGNGAAVRHQGGNVKLSRVVLHGNQNGLLGPAKHVPCTLEVDQCEVYGNGTGTGQTHGLYVGIIDRFTCTRSRFRATRIGHHIKSRALTTIVQHCVVGEDFAGNESYNIDIPVGGDALVEDCELRQGPATDNSIMLNYGSERNPHPGGSLRIRRCKFESKTGGVGIRNALPGVVAEIEDCDFIGLQDPVTGNHALKNCRLNGKPLPDRVRQS